jgi:hypothetical protein
LTAINASRARQLHRFTRTTTTSVIFAVALVFHPEWATNRPWFEHTWEDLTENGRYYCPYVHLEPKEARRIRMLRRYVPDVLPLVRKADWHCSAVTAITTVNGTA